MSLINMVNYLVPAAGTTHAYPIFNTLVAGQTYGIDFNMESIDGQVFMPSGVFVDNSQGTQPLSITIVETGYTITCPAGQYLQVPYAAPNSQHVNFTGEGPVSIQFVDFPVQPFQTTPTGSSSAVTIANGADVALGTTTDPAVFNPAAAATAISLLKGIITQNAAVLAKPATSAITNVVAATADTLVLAGNANRLGAIVFNDSTAGILYLRCATGAATTVNYTAVIQPGGSFVLGRGDYTGEMRGIWSAATGFTRVTEFTA